MNLELFIAKRLIFGDNKKQSGFTTQSLVKIAVGGIALGMIVMILSIAIVVGFKQQITDKVVGFGGHILITNYDNNSSYETFPINKNLHFFDEIQSLEGVEHIQKYGYKVGIIKTKSAIQGVVFKGIGSDYNPDFLKKNLVEGEILQLSDTARTNRVLVSSTIADLLKLKCNDEFVMYFIQQPPRLRKFKIAGIYHTGIEEYDKLFIIGDLAHVQRLNKWGDDKISGFELLISDFDKLDEITDEMKNIAGMQFFEDGSSLKVSNVKQENQQIFEWLKLIDTNVWVILALMLTVAAFNMISGLLILILERTNMIGILKALGHSNLKLRKVFLYKAFFLIGKGLLWGNSIGLLICFVQQEFKLVSLDSSSYYVSTVPIEIVPLHIILLNIITILITLLMLIVPSFIISRISPIKAIKYN